jgi:diadenylate cyclase
MALKDILSQITLRNIFDIAIVAVLFYQIIAMLKGTRAAQVVVGLLVIFIAYALSSLLEFETLYWIISKFYASFIIVVIVLFQDDIRRLLTRFGKTPFVGGLEEGSGLSVIEEVVSSAKNLSHERLGAIMVFERGIGLERLYDHAVRLDALVSEQLLLSIFQSFSPLHDGAVIIQKNRILCASAHLPLSKTTPNALTGKKMGTRHSAATGISEQTDAVVLVVSEETGAISIASNGELYRQQSPEAAKRMLTQLLVPQKRASRLAVLLENRVFYAWNTWALRMRAFVSGKPYKGPERRTRTAAERRNMHASAWSPNRDTMTAVERENRLASSELRLNLRFPGSIPQRRTFQSAGGVVVLSNAERSRSRAGNSDLPQSEAPMENADGSHPPLSMSEEPVSIPMESPSVMEQNEAAAALSQFGPEERFVPPEPPTPPPRDVSIGGVSLNPPVELDDEHPEREREKRKHIREDKGGDA